MIEVLRPRRRAQLARREPSQLALDVLAQRSGLHPETVRRLVQLGLVQPSGGSSSAPLFRPQDAQLLARAARLRRDLGLNYAGAVLACELLARIEQLEERDGGGVPRPRQQEVIAWTQTV